MVYLDWISDFNNAISFIEDHITRKLTVDDVSNVTNMSGYHFQRMFAVMTGISFSEYLRRRKMTLAVADLKMADSKVIDVALKYGYASPTAFNRAFQSVHGVAPSLAKHDGVTFKSYQPLVFQMMVEGVHGFDYKIEKMDGFKVVGRSIELAGDMDEMGVPIEQFWKLLNDNGILERFRKMSDGETLEVMLPDAKTEVWKYLIGVKKAQDVDTLESYDVLPYTWAKFKEDGASGAVGLGYRVIKEWLPYSGYEYDDGPDIQIHDKLGNLTEFWIPVRQKEHVND